ncbi:MAG TPA: sugar-binding protein, partial [Clostridiales bacterium]|nr:sugar-binding protein [Clostridiales bacterium]
TYYQEDDGQYRVNFENMATFNPEDIAAGFESAVRVSGSHYIVEMKIPFRIITPKADMQIGFDVQINDAKGGVRQSVANWNDASGNGYQDTSVFGTLTLKK